MPRPAPDGERGVGSTTGRGKVDEDEARRVSEPPAVPLLDLGRRIDALRGEIDRALARVVSSHAFVLGREVERFEAAVA